MSVQWFCPSHYRVLASLTLQPRFRAVVRPVTPPVAVREVEGRAWMGECPIASGVLASLMSHYL